MTDVSGAHAPGPARALKRSSELIDQLSELKIMVATTVNLLAYKIRSRNCYRRFSSLLCSKQSSFKFSFRIEITRAWLHSQVSLAGYLENPTDVCSTVYDAKEDVLSSYQTTA